MRRILFRKVPGFFAALPAELPGTVPGPRSESAGKGGTGPFFRFSQRQDAQMLQQDLQSDQDEDDASDELGMPAVPAPEGAPGNDPDS